MQLTSSSPGVTSLDRAHAQVVGQALCALRRAVPHLHLGAHGPERPGHRPGAPPRPEHDRARGPRLAQRGQEAGRVGVVGLDAVAVEGQRVRGADRPAVSVARSAAASAASLWGIVTLAPTKPAAGSARTVSASRPGGTGRQLVVPAVQGAGLVGGLVDRRRAAVGHRPAQDAGAPRQQLTGEPPLAWRACSYWVASRWNSASVLAKACSPHPQGLTTKYR